MAAQRLSRTGLIDRSVQWRDTRLFILATEGSDTEKQYFQGLQERGVIDQSRIKIEVIPTPHAQGDSAPQHVLARLTEFAARYKGIKEDELWLVIDTDRWQQHLPQVTQEALQKGFFVAVSCPCIELWLLLHVTDDVASMRTCKDCELALRRHLGGYNKANLDMDRFPRATIEAAIERARALDTGTNRWPQSVGSHVHRLASRLLGMR